MLQGPGRKDEEEIAVHVGTAIVIRHRFDSITAMYVRTYLQFTKTTKT